MIPSGHVGAAQILETLIPTDLLDIIVQLRGEVAGLRAEDAALKDEIRRLKGLPPRPTLKPSGME